MAEPTKTTVEATTTQKRRLSVVDLGAYELRFYAPLADEVLARRGAIIDAAFARAMLWGRVVECEAAERLDKGLRRALSQAKKEAREQSAHTGGAKRLARLLVDAAQP